MFGLRAHAGFLIVLVLFCDSRSETLYNYGRNNWVFGLKSAISCSMLSGMVSDGEFCLALLPCYYFGFLFFTIFLVVGWSLLSCMKESPTSYFFLTILGTI